jgi:hypothetical protein
MKRLVILGVAALSFALLAGGSLTYAQGTFKIPFEFKAGGKSFPSGEYWVALRGEGEIALRKGPDGAEVAVPFIQKLEQPKQPPEEPRLVFDMVGNFEPSYTEYVTDYLLAEVWLPGEGGFLIHTTKGAHQSKTIKGQAAKK